MRDRSYDVAQICLNGHVINTRSEGSPDHNTKHCADCGEKTITSCRDCGGKIRGALSGVYNLGSDPAPGYCTECGKPYPWTQSKIEAFQDLVDLSSLNQDSKTILLDGIIYVIRDTPKTEAVCAKFAKIIPKLKPQESSIISILSNMATDHAKKILEEFGVGL